jgi:serine/threonine protein kinase/tetratricopeptide (TPR) repeat protein
MTGTDPELKIPGYRILRELGRGGMARVYLAVQESMEREVAIKVMLPALAASDPSFSERFLREARIVAKLSHPHIIAVIDVGVVGPYHYYSMEYHTGGDLKARIHEGMMPKMALSLTRQVASALAFAHSKGYVHRDVKPENVIFRHDGTALLTDFGIAKASDGAARMTATGAIIGTPHYMSPEQAQGAELDHRSDLYSLGVMLYEMLTGSVPYNGTSALAIGIKHLKDPIPRLPPPLQVYQPLLDRFLAKNPADRFQSGEEAIAAIDAMMSGTHSTLAGTTTPTRFTGNGLATQATVVPNQISGTHARTRVSGNYAATQVTGVPSGGSRRGLTLGLVALVPVLAVAAYFILRSPSPDPAATAPAPVVSVPAPAADNKSGRIAQLLAEADVAAVAGRYLEPRDQSAVAKYRQVLELDAGNARAMRGLQEIAKYYIAQTDRALDRKNLDDAAANLKQGEETDPANPLLAARRQAIQEARARSTVAAAKPEIRPAARPARKPEPPPAKPARLPAEASKPVVAAAPRVSEAQEREQRLSAHIARIKELIAPGGLTTTRAGLATEIYAEAAKLSPNDPRVLNISNQIADAYLKLATSRADDKDYKEAEHLIRKGLELVPNHRLLASLQKDIAARQKTKHQTFGGF